MKDAVMTRTVNTRSGYVICFEWRRTRIQRNFQQRLSKKSTKGLDDHSFGYSFCSHLENCPIRTCGQERSCFRMSDENAVNGIRWKERGEREG